MDDNEIEISVPAKIEAGFYFKVDRAAWAALSDADKIKTIGDHLESAAATLSLDVIPLGTAFMSAEIVGPNDDEIDLGDVMIYDPSA